MLCSLFLEASGGPELILCSHRAGPVLQTYACCLSFLPDSLQTPPLRTVPSTWLCPHSRPCLATSSMCLLPFAFCRDFDSLSKDNVFENNRLVSPGQTEAKGGGWAGLLLSPTPASLQPAYPWSTSPSLGHPVESELRVAHSHPCPDPLSL